MGCRYICRDNHLLNCSIIFIIVAQYTQMYLKNLTALAEDNSEHSNSLNVVPKRNSKLNYQSQSHIATDGQSVSKSWCQAPSGAHDQIFITVLTVTVLFFMGCPL
jgi:hypothetical protein